MPSYRHSVIALLRTMPRYRHSVIALVRGWILFRKLRRNPAFGLVGAVLLDRRTRRAAARLFFDAGRLLFELGRNPRLRRVIVRRLPSR